METYRIKIGHIERELPIRALPSGVRIAFFQLLGDVELCEAAAAGLAAAAGSSCDLVVTAESKGVPLAHELARLTRVPYLVMRKDKKDYMADPVSETVRSITTSRVQRLWIDAGDLAPFAGGQIWIVDDVVSTGGTLQAASALLASAGAPAAKRMAVLSEGPPNPETEDVMTLGHLPLF